MNQKCFKVKLHVLYSIYPDVCVIYIYICMNQKCFKVKLHVLYSIYPDVCVIYIYICDRICENHASGIIINFEI